VHEKKLLFGSISHFPKERLDYLKKPFFELLIFPEKITEKDLEIDTSILQEYKVKYIIVHPDRYKEQDKELGLLKTIPFLEKKFKRIYQDEEVIVYEVEHEGN
ncbi:hypothetical protein HYS48_02115, partial [Candidatus Woesearchaeota archaeon]|nr:hypothetical protein [Candidatus Woesearchaeota archaeon]